ncbi:MAG: choice-of-anchor D domain-containing protein [Flavobacteriaceae bacterium]
MKNITFSIKCFALVFFTLFFSNISVSQDFNVQHLNSDVPRTGATSSITSVSSLNNAFVLNNNNRLAQAGRSDENASNLTGRDLSGAVRLTGTSTVTYYRESNSVNSNTKFNASVWEYIGSPGGNNEFIVRGRYIVNLNGTTNNTTQALTGVSSANKCIPFITGIITDVSSAGADSGSVIAYLENASTMRVQKGSNANNVSVYITLVEFTGSNWTILHGDSGSVDADSGNITLRANSDGTGTATNVSDWNESIIFTHHRGNMSDNAVDQAIADNWPIISPGGNNQTVSWGFDSNHDAQTSGNRHFVHVANNSNISVSRFSSDTSSSSGESTIDISSASLTSLSEALIVGTSISSGGGTAYGRGWRNYYLNSTTQAAHWAHRSGNTMSHEIQIVNLYASAPTYCSSNGNNTNDEYIGRVQLNTIDNSSGVGTTSTGYSDFTAISTNLNQSTLYTITVTPTWPGTTYSEGYSVWIDYNQDGDFVDAGEQVWTTGPTTTFPVSGAFTVPGTATLGSTRMRVSMKYNGIPTSCESFNYGEVEDYTINITAASPTPEINLVGNGTNIIDGDTTPSVTDDTDFGNVDVTIGTNPNTFTIQNLGTASLNLTGGSPYVAISGAHAADFTLTANPTTPIAASGNTTFTITFNPSATGLRTATVTIANDDSNENPYNFDIQGTGTTTLPEINIRGNGVDIADGDVTPSILDDTDFGNVDVTSGTNVNTFTIQNLGASLNLNLTGGSPYVVVSGTHAADFTVTAIPASTIAAGGSATFNITFNPSALGLRTATLTIANDDSDENPYNFSIQGTGTDACGGYITTYPYIEDFESGLGQITQDTGDNFDWIRDSGGTGTGSTGPSDAVSGSFYLYTEANGNNNLTANLFTPCLDLTGTTNPRFILHHHMYGSSIGTLNIDLSTDSGTTYPTNLWTRTGQIQTANNASYIPISIDLSAYIGQTVKIRIQGIVGSGNTSDMAIDYLAVIDKPEPTIAPGGVTADLGLWLKGNDGTHTNGQNVSLWQDQGRGSDARPYKSGQEPTYRDNVNKNVNFNPVVEFDNTYSSFTIDSDYSHDNTSEKFLTGDFGYYTQDIFIVLIPDDTAITNSFGFMDVISGDSTLDVNSTDTTGIGFGDYTGRVSGEIICYAYDTYTSSESGDGYAVAEIGTGSSYDNAGIINTRNNSADTQQELYYNANDIETTQNDVAEYANANDTRFWLGRSEGWEATTNARIAEVISYSARKVDTDLTQERNRIQSYLALKYGITLGVNGTSQDYVNSDGTVIWDQNTGVPANDVFNYDIAGIGRDDASGLYQKQSRSVNNDLDSGSRGQGVLTMGLANVYDTNNLNPNTINDKEFLIWGNDGVDLDDPAVVVDVDMSTSISPVIPGGTWVQFNGIARTWKVVESGGDVPEVEVQVLTSAIRTAAPPNGQYLMFISNTPNFDPTADYRVMTQTTNELGEAIVETTYDFDGTKYITFGWAPERVYTRSIYFDGVSDYVDMDDNLDLNPTSFTISSWVMREAGSNNKSILSKRDLAYTEGYDFKINSTGRFEVSWKNGSTQTITSSVVIPQSEWHHLAIIYSGGTATLYIDGVPDTSASLTAPVSTTRNFNLAAAGKGASLGDFFIGNIDEVRVWDTALTVDQLRYIMNQEIENNSSFVNGTVIPQTITKNEVSTVPWSNLAGYYPMTTYTYTNTKDESGNGNTGALRNLRTVDRQTAPLPYQSQNNGDWTTDATWLNSTVQTLPNALSIVDGVTPVNWNIVETNHNVNIATDAILGREREVLGLFVSSNTLSVNGVNASGTGNGLTVTHYLELDGEIDLNGESQLIQTINSDLVVGASGKLYRDQQGTADTYTYNYWSSPVGIDDEGNNEYRYTLPQVMKDGTLNINFISTGYNGTNTSPIGLADYWIWKFANQPDDDYSAWQHIRSTGDMYAGEGFTMKGPGTGSITTDQNYVFSGKPNNGDINLTISVNSDYLVGNPYASAIDAYTFINDNSSSITGTLYFWEHFGGGNHNLADYQGGYHMLNLSGATTVATYISNDPDVSAAGTPISPPGNFIPVSQGFFVVASGSGGTINFNNGQRVFHKESSGNSTFVGMNDEVTEGGITPITPLNVQNNVNDSRLKIRIGFNSINTIRRQLLATMDENATMGIDWGYDGAYYEDQMDDMFWMIDNEKFVIQGINEIGSETILPLGLFTSDDGENKIMLDKIENDPGNLDVFLHDKVLNIYHNLNSGSYNIYLPAGEYLDRFEITFTDFSPLDVNEFEIDNIDVHYSNAIESIVLINPTNQNIKSIELINILGQSIKTINNISNADYKEYEVKNLSSGTYIIKMETEKGTVSKKVLVE